MVIQKIPYKEFSYIYSKVPRICVDLFLSNNEGVLLSKRDIPPAKGLWHFPGGTILLGETSRKAAVRIAKEELKIRIRIVKFLGFIEYDRKFSFGQSISLVYKIYKTGGLLSGSDQAEEISFFKKIPSHTIPDVRLFLSRYYFF